MTSTRDRLARRACVARFDRDECLCWQNNGHVETDYGDGQRACWLEAQAQADAILNELTEPGEGALAATRRRELALIADTLPDIAARQYWQAILTAIREGK